MTSESRDTLEHWELGLERVLPLFGHRNWIVVADSAYPAQSNPGIETIATGAGAIEVLEKTLTAIQACPHVRGNVWIDAELRAVDEADAPGVTEFRDRLAQRFQKENLRELEHEKIIAKLDEGGKLFRVLILKTALAIPYTSVFIELDCGYWSAAAEKRLRDSLTNA